jgi:hypothetical protein
MASNIALASRTRAIQLIVGLKNSLACFMQIALEIVLVPIRK